MEWERTASGVAAVGASGGALWIMFRFLVGAACADRFDELRDRIKDLETVKHETNEKLDRLLALLEQ